jgi:uncharacterized repeat protein (TIGR01451 family)
MLKSLILMLLLPLHTLAANATVPWACVGLGGGSTQSGRVVLTVHGGSEVGGMWNPCSISLGSAFDLVFAVNFGSDQCGGDGLAFVLQTQGTGVLGLNSGEHGYSNGSINSNSLALIFDTYQDSGAPYFDPSYDSIGVEYGASAADKTVCSGGDVVSSSGTCRPAISATQSNIKDGNDHSVEIIYNPGPGTLAILVDGSSRVTYTLPTGYLSSIFGGASNVYYGWTASTGGTMNIQQVAQMSANPSVCMATATPASGAIPTPPPIYPCGSFTPTPTDTPTATPTIASGPFISKSSNASVAAQAGQITYALNWSYVAGPAQNDFQVVDTLPASAQYGTYSIASGISPTSFTKTGGGFGNPTLLVWDWSGAAIVPAASNGQINVVTSTMGSMGSVFVNKASALALNPSNGTYDSNIVAVTFATATPTLSFTVNPSLTWTWTITPTLSSTPTFLTAGPSNTISPSPTMTSTVTPTVTPAVCGAPNLLQKGIAALGCFTTSNSISYNNPGGANTVMLVRIEEGSSNTLTPSSISYAGAGMTLVRQDVLGYTTGNVATYVLSNPATGSNNLVVNYPSGSCSWNLEVELWTNANTASPIGGTHSLFSSSGVSSFAVDLTTTGSVSAVDDYLAIPQVYSGSEMAAVGSSQSTHGLMPGCCEEVYGDDKIVVGAGSQLMSYTLSQSKTWFAQLVEVNGIGCGSPTVSPTATSSITPGGPSATQTLTITQTGTRTSTLTATCTLTVTPSATPTPALATFSPTLTPAALLVKSANPSIASNGDTVTYSLNWSYNSALPATGMDINDALPVQASYLSYQVVAGPTPTTFSTNGGNSPYWVWSSLPPTSSSGQIDLVVKVLGGGGSFLNQAYISSTNAGGGTATWSNLASVTFKTATPVPLQTLPPVDRWHPKAYPNPVRHGKVRVVFAMPQPGSSHIRFYNAAGHLVGTFDFSWSTAGQQFVDLDMSAFAPGLYFFIIDRSYSNGRKDSTVLQKVIVLK